MQSVERSFRAVGESVVLERVRNGPKELGNWVGYSTSGESSPTPIGSDRGHPHSFKRYPDVQEEKGTDCGADGRSLG